MMNASLVKMNASLVKIMKVGRRRKPIMLIGLLLICLSLFLAKDRLLSYSLAPPAPALLHTFQPPLTLRSFKAIKRAEHQHRLQLATLSEEEQAQLQGLHHRDIKWNWGNHHGLLPGSKPTFYWQCLQYAGRRYKEGVSVVISYRDELLSILLRTLTTLVLRTPPGNLREVIFVDDGSLIQNKGEILDHARALDVSVKWFRHNISAGIANARYFGIKEASSEVTVVLDSHMVVSDMWLQPLLDTLVSRPRAVVVPIVQMIMDDEFDKFYRLKTNPYCWKMIGGYQGLDYTEVPPHAYEDFSVPYQTPVIGGGALAGFTKVLQELWPVQVTEGAWGVENLRLSLRAWSCGGGLWTNACSQLTHPNGLDPNLDRYNILDKRISRNRLVETAAEITSLIRTPADRSRLIRSTYFSALESDIQTTSERFTELFNYTSCEHDYDWYLQNVHLCYNYKYFDDSRFSHVGLFQSRSSPELCLHNDHDTNLVTSRPCPGLGEISVSDPGLLGFSTSPQGVVTAADRFYCPSCWDANHSGEQQVIRFWDCHKEAGKEAPPQQRFRFAEAVSQIQHMDTNRCVEIVGKDQVQLNTCDVDKVEQKWTIHSPKWWRST